MMRRLGLAFRPSPGIVMGFVVMPMYFLALRTVLVRGTCIRRPSYVSVADLSGTRHLRVEDDALLSRPSIAPYSASLLHVPVTQVEAKIQRSSSKSGGGSHARHYE